MSNNSELFKKIGIIVIVVVVIIVAVIIIVLVRRYIIRKKQQELLGEVLNQIHLDNIDSQLEEFDDVIVVNNKKTFDNYSDLKYIKDNKKLDDVRENVKRER